MSYIKSYIIKPTIKDFYVPSFCRGCWIFDNTTKKIIDYSQYANHGTNNGSINKGNYNYFNGTSDYVLLPTGIYNNSQFAVGVVIKAPANNDKTIFGEGNNSNIAPNFKICSNNVSPYKKLRVTARDNSMITNLDITSSAEIFDNEAYHSIIYWESNGIYKLIIDNIVDTQGTYTKGTLTLNRTALGCLIRTTLTSFFNGNIANASQYINVDIHDVIAHQKILAKNLI